ncbi:MAG: type II secretion system protein GspJ [Natronospirillum sp.]
MRSTLTPTRPCRGFTLLELMIAILVTALLASGTLTLVFQFSLTSERVTERLQGLDRLQAVHNRLRQDFEQFAPQRGVADEFNNPQPALESNDDTLLVLTRHGWPQSAITPSLRSDLQRVTYEQVPIIDERCRMGLSADQWQNRDELTGFCLVRRYRQHIEAESDNPWREQVVLAPMDGMNLVFTAVNNSEETTTSEVWPPEAQFSDDEPLSLRMISVTLDFPGFSPAEFHWLVPGAILPPAESVP